MLTTPSEAISISKIYTVPPEDVLFLDFSICGVAVNFPYARVRFELTPEYNPLFKTSFSKGINKYFFALPSNPNSPYRIENGQLVAKREIIGKVRYFSSDTCDSSYPRRNGTVLNLNPIPKSQCHGCKFCHTLVQDAKDINEDLQSKTGLEYFIERWLEKYDIPDLSYLIQVAIVTGCFGGEARVVQYLKDLATILNEYGFNGEILYYGSEITTEGALNELKEIKPFTLCLSLECFENRERMLRSHKRKITIADSKNILHQAKKNGFNTTFSYILGLESLTSMRTLFTELFPYINRFPIINIFQIHKGQEKLRCQEAWKIDYYMDARRILEKMFINTNMRPRPWENYRSLWYLKFDGEWLDDIRTP